MAVINVAFWLAIVASIALVTVILLVARAYTSLLPLITSFVAGATAILGSVVTVVGIVTRLTADRLTVTVPIDPMGIRLTPGFAIEPPATATIVAGGFNQVIVEAEGIGLSARWAYAASALLSGVTLVGVAVVVWRLARATRSGDPFRLSSKALTWAALIVAGGGILASVAADLANMLASRDLFQSTGWMARDVPSLADDLTPADFGWPEPVGFALSIPFWPLAAGLVLALLAGVFRYGAQLRRETEGLI
ncbi:MAG: hypothetical protein LBK54_03035 [Propionibacteriaceae bacterium]|jgi:hypothetical protein|nr:hypothetical protein [Propionibacteriaceae bacterium]